MESITKYGTEPISVDPLIAKPVQNTDWIRRNKFRALCGVLLIATIGAVLFVQLAKGHHEDVSPSNISAVEEVQSNIDSNLDLIEGDVDLVADGSSVDIYNCAHANDESCDPTYGCKTFEEDIQAVANCIYNNWDDYRDWIESHTTYSLWTGCLKKKFKKGNVYCDAVCTGVCGYAGGGKINLCENTFLDELDGDLRPDRRACIAALMAHEFSHLCARSESACDEIEEETFAWWEDTYAVSAGWTHDDCPCLDR
eukprot:359909_1